MTPLLTFSLQSSADPSGRVRMVNGVDSRSRMFWKEQGILGETSSKLLLKVSVRCGSLLACFRSPSPTCRTSMLGPRTRWKGKARQNVLSPMRKSSGDRDSWRDVAAVCDDEDAGWVRSSRIRKDKQAGDEDEGGDGDEEGEESVESSPSSLAVCSHLGGASSTETSDW